MSLCFHKYGFYILILSILGFTACKFNPPGIVEPSDLKELTTLPANVTESSGLAFVGQQLWTHNDSGNATQLYQVDTQTEKLIHTLHISGVSNKDWEELALDNQFLYIGDFGNNGGNRQDLQIYKIDLHQLNSTIQQTDISQRIQFKYQDQTRFNHAPYQHDFDCEAMIVFGDSLYLFSKNHHNKRCNLYHLSKTDSISIATKIDSFDSRGTITAADYQSDSKVLALLGYQFIAGNDMPAFVWLFYDFEGTHFFKGQSAYIDLKLNSQAEGLTFINDTEILISTEAENGGRGRLYHLDISAYLE